MVADRQSYLLGTGTCDLLNEVSDWLQDRFYSRFDEIFVLHNSSIGFSLNLRALQSELFLPGLLV